MDPKKITPSTDSVYKIEATISWIFLLLINQHVAGQFKRITGDGKIHKYKRIMYQKIWSLQLSDNENVSLSLYQWLHTLSLATNSTQTISFSCSEKSRKVCCE